MPYSLSLNELLSCKAFPALSFHLIGVRQTSHFLSEIVDYNQIKDFKKCTIEKYCFLVLSSVCNVH